MHVVDLSTFHLKKTKRIQLSLNSESDLTGRKHHKRGAGWASIKDGIKFYSDCVSLHIKIQITQYSITNHEVVRSWLTWRNSVTWFLHSFLHLQVFESLIILHDSNILVLSMIFSNICPCPDKGKIILHMRVSLLLYNVLWRTFLRSEKSTPALDWRWQISNWKPVTSITI